MVFSAVSAHNHRFDANDYLDAVPLDAVQEIHVAGHFVQHFAADDGSDRVVLIDDHGTRVEPAVWSLFRRALERIGPVPTLMEWDNNIPALDVLLAEARKAELILSAVRAHHSKLADVHVA